jgi:transposase
MSHGVQQCLEEVQSLRQRLEPSRWREEDWGMADHVLASYERGLTALVEAQLTLPQLLHLLRGQRRKPCPPGGPQASSRGENAAEQEAPADSAWQEETAVEVTTSKPRGGHRSGTGRLGADASRGAQCVVCRHEEWAVGQVCPVCGRGRLYQIAPRREMRIDGHALLSAVRYERERLRCSACGLVLSAPLPAEAGQDKYSPQARAVLAVGRYFLGLPFSRLQAYQAMLGVPVPDATQWDQIEQVADCAYVLFEQMEKEAAQGELIFQDDTAVRSVSLLKENLQLLASAEAQGLAKPKERTGMHTTALVVKVGEHTAILYYSSRRHAGENLQGLLDKREAGLAKPLAMSDALVSDEVADEAAVIRCHCLAHGRRKFSDLEAVFPQECQVVLEVIKQVFDHDEQARQEQLRPEARLAYHQAQSQPLMEELKGWLDKQLDDHLVEPNSSLGKAIAYMQSHWETLTRFLSIPGAPLDNNVAERVLKLFIRQRKNSLVYKSPHSAYIASVLTSLIATCIYAGVNAVDYLVALQEHRSEVFADPAAWLPWAYARSRASP